MAADLGRFLILVSCMLRGEPLSIVLASWPESRCLAGYGHVSWETFLGAIQPAFITFQRLWEADPTLAIETLAPYVRDAIAERERERFCESLRA